MKQLDVKTIPLDTKVLIEASAGTGKTYTIGLLVLRLLLEKLITIEKIVLITFTEAAALELRKKTAEKILEAYNLWESGAFKDDDLSYIVEAAKKAKNSQHIKVNLLDAIARIDEMPVFTIHGFCKKLLEEFAFEIGNFEKKEVITNINKIKEKVVADFWRENIKDLDASIKIKPSDLSKAINNILNHNHAKITGEDFSEKSIESFIQNENEKELKYALLHKFAKVIYDKLQEEKQKLKVMYFSDMIEDCYSGVLKDKDNNNILLNAVQKRYDAIMVDEFQDTDRIQFEIFDYLFKDKPFFMIGDPKQAIYKFRGGDIFAYKEARHKAGKNQYSMDTNFRSEQTLLDALNLFFKSESFKMGDDIEYNQVKCGKIEEAPLQKIDNQYKPFVIIKGGYEKDEDGNIVKIKAGKGITDYNRPDSQFKPKIKQAIILEIKRLLNTGNIEPKDIAILLDNNNDCIEYKNALTLEGIPSIVKGAAVLSSDAAMFIRILLNAVCYNNNVRYTRALITNRYSGYKPEEIDENVFIDWSKIIYDTKIRWEEAGIMNAIEYFMGERDMWSRILNDINGERNITNIRQIIEILNEEELETGRVPEKLNNRFAILCTEAENDEETEEKLETDDDALKIMTIHKSKGLQFNIVFAPNINRNPKHTFPEPYMYHNEKNEEVIAYYANDDHAKSLNDKEEKEETARLLYVALTRAKLRLYASFLTPGKNSKNKAHGSHTSLCREVFDNFCDSFTDNADFSNIQIEELDNLLIKDFLYEPRSKIGDNKKQARKLSKKIEPSWYRTSFTGISSFLTHPEYVFTGSRAKDEPPAGKRMGTLLHNIFEDIEFDANEKEIKNLIETKLGGYKEFSGEEGEQKKNWIKDKVVNILSKDLPGAGKLCDIKDNLRVTELNFFMSSPSMKLNTIKEIMGNKISEFENEDIIAKYIKGAIDLIFLGKDNKYYILDWKSNSLNDYSVEGMENEAMIPHGYHLQYGIYAVALKRWLEKTHQNFDFRTQFGGIFYIFVRGVNDVKDNYDGVYYASSEEIADEIIKLDECFLNNTHIRTHK